MSSYSSPVSSAQEDVNRPDIRNGGGGGFECANRCITRVCDTHTRSLTFGDFISTTGSSSCSSSLT